MKTRITHYNYLNFPKQYNKILFCTWTLLSACCHTCECLLKKTSSETSLPLGKQCKKIQFLLALLINFLSILNFLKACIFFFLLTLSFKEITLSENTTSAPDIAFFGSL